MNYIQLIFVHNIINTMNIILQDGKTPVEVTNDEAIKLILCTTVPVMKLSPLTFD